MIYLKNEKEKKEEVRYQTIVSQGCLFKSPFFLTYRHSPLQVGGDHHGGGMPFICKKVPMKENEGSSTPESFLLQQHQTHRAEGE